MRRRRAFFSRRSGYKAALEILLALAVLQGIFFIINNYKKPKPEKARLKVTRPAIVRPKITVSKAQPPKPKKAVVTPPEPAVKRRPPAAVARGKIAIVLDDWGYSLNNIPIVDGIKAPFTAAVLPNLRHSQSAAEQLHQRGVEVILHLPMEPQARLGMEQDTILTSMDEDRIRGIIRGDLDNVLYAKGANNHMGSKATEDPRVMEEVFKELKKRRLYFLDSAVTAQSVGFNLAKKMGIPFIERDIFLDNKPEAEYIKAQLAKLKTIAKEKGFAVGIGHDRRVTLQTLKDTVPELEEEGYKFVFVSELIE